jgi:hypothetical protein
MWFHQGLVEEGFIVNIRKIFYKCKWRETNGLKDVEESDIYIGIFAWRYGYIPQRTTPPGAPSLSLNIEKQLKPVDNA